MGTQATEHICKTCEESFEWGYNEDYCSEDCLLKSKGENVLRQVATDHKYCTSCFRVRKTVEEPPEWFLQQRPVSIRESIVGFEYYTEHIHKDHGFTYCECGNIDHYDQHEFLRDLELHTAVKNLARLLVEFYKDNQVPNKPDVRALAKTIKETDDYPLAIGKSVYG